MALMALKTNRPVKACLARSDDMMSTGKRHHFISRYQVGFDKDGRFNGLDLALLAGCGNSPDLSDAIVDRAMFHADNAYFLPAARVVGHRVKTNTVSNTAFRGFGGPQGILAMENIIDQDSPSIFTSTKSQRGIHRNQENRHIRYRRSVCKSWTEETISEGMQALEQDFSPISDFRGSSEYRLEVSKNLLLRYFLERNSTPESLIRITQYV